MQYDLRLSGRHHRKLRKCLIRGDTLESGAVALCGRHVSGQRVVLLVQRVLSVPDSAFVRREADYLEWSTEWLIPVLQEASSRGLAIVKFHSHPGGFVSFSAQDDESDRLVMEAIDNWFDDPVPHASAVMLEDGSMFGRVLSHDGVFQRLARISVASNDIRVFGAGNDDGRVPEGLRRHAQLFGSGTTNRLRNLTAAVVGCSGTGSIVIEQLARLGIGRLILVDPDRMEEKNLNRITGSTRADADCGRFKVHVLADYVRQMGQSTQVTPIPGNLIDADVIRLVAGADVLIGCMDTHEGRAVLNRVAASYVLPYFDVGVHLQADGNGGIEQVCGAVHYLQPGGSSLLSRGMVSREQVRAESMHRRDPSQYSELREQNYIAGVDEDRPAVIAVNMHFASMAVLEFLARLHPFRYQENVRFAIQQISLSDSDSTYTGEDGEPCPALAKLVGAGDTDPPLGMPDLG